MYFVLGRHKYNNIQWVDPPYQCRRECLVLGQKGNLRDCVRCFDLLNQYWGMVTVLRLSCTRRCPPTWISNLMIHWLLISRQTERTFGVHWWVWLRDSVLDPLRDSVLDPVGNTSVQCLCRSFFLSCCVLALTEAWTGTCLFVCWLANLSRI